MPNIRHQDQTQIGFALPKSMLAAIDRARSKQGAERSRWLRRAIIIEIAKAGIDADPAWEMAPDRSGKRKLGSVNSDADQSAFQSHQAAARARKAAAIAASKSKSSRPPGSGSVRKVSGGPRPSGGSSCTPGKKD